MRAVTAPRVVRNGAPVKFPRRLFKFLPREWAVKLARDGNVKLGTLFEYGDAKYKDGTFDPDEGKLWQTEHANGTRGRNLTPRSQRMMVNAENVTFINSSFTGL